MMIVAVKTFVGQLGTIASLTESDFYCNPCFPTIHTRLDTEKFQARKPHL